MRDVKSETRMPVLRRITQGVVLFLAILPVLVGCAVPRSLQRLPLTTEGELFVYLAPLSQESDRLAFSLAELSAVRNNGDSVPLRLILDTPTKGERTRQRLLGRGLLPPGEYRGIRFRIAKATVDTEDGSVAMHVSERGEESPLRFEVKQQKGVVVEASFSGNAARSAGYSLRPVFLLTLPPPPLPSLTGYLTIPSENRVVVFDKRNGAVGRSIATGAEPSDVVFDRPGRRGYLSLAGEDAIAVVDLADHEINHRIRLNSGDAPAEMAMAQSGATLLVVNEGSNSVAFIDPAGLREIGRIATGFAPKGIAVDRSGTLACVCNSESQSVTVIDIASRQQVAELVTDPNPLLCQFSSDSSRLLVGHRRTPYLFVYDLGRRAILERLTVFGGVSALKVDSKNDRFYVAASFGGSIAVYNQSVETPIDFVGSRRVTTQLTIDGDESSMLAVQHDDGTVRIIDLVGKNDKAVVDAGGPPFRVTVAGER